MKPRQRACIYCGRMFLSDHRAHLYCSGACRTAAYRNRAEIKAKRQGAEPPDR
jgi:hypothetical protein